MTTIGFLAGMILGSATTCLLVMKADSKNELTNKQCDDLEISFYIIGALCFLVFFYWMVGEIGGFQ